jgi:hypothetical protein
MMQIWEFLELAALAILVPFLVFVVLPFGLARIIGWAAGVCP